VGRGRANNGWSDRPSYLETRDQEHGCKPDERWATLSCDLTIKEMSHAEGVTMRHPHREPSVGFYRTGAIGDAAMIAGDV
jgi:hypothetical protein